MAAALGTDALCLLLDSSGEKGICGVLWAMKTLSSLSEQRLHL